MSKQDRKALDAALHAKAGSQPKARGVEAKAAAAPSKHMAVKEPPVRKKHNVAEIALRILAFLCSATIIGISSYWAIFAWTLWPLLIPGV